MARRSKKTDTAVIETPTETPVVLDNISAQLTLEAPSTETAILASDRVVFDAFNEECFSEARTGLSQSQPWPFYTRDKHSPVGKGKHQFPWMNWGASCNPVMPSYALFCETGNPYPSSASDPSVKPSRGYEHYRIVSALAYVAFEMLRDGWEGSANDLYFKTEIFDRACVLFNLNARFNPSAKNNFMLDGLVHSFREMEVCAALVVPGDVRRYQGTSWKIQPCLLKQ